MKPKTLQTTDADVATYLILQGHQPVRINTDSEQWLFIFKENVKEDFDAFYTGNDMPYRPSVYSAQRKRLKQLAYQS